jgi:hypothetical protein
MMKRSNNFKVAYFTQFQKIIKFKFVELVGDKYILELILKLKLEKFQSF